MQDTREKHVPAAMQLVDRIRGARGKIWIADKPFNVVLDTALPSYSEFYQALCELLMKLIDWTKVQMDVSSLSERILAEIR